MPQPFPPLAISEYWAGVQAHILRIVELLPDDKFDYTPDAALWNSRGIVIHVADARDSWLARTVQDGDPYPNVWTIIRTREDMARELARTFARVERFLANSGQLDAKYGDDYNGEVVEITGHWIAFHLLEHDIHHRAELLQRLAHLGIEHGIDI